MISFKCNLLISVAVVQCASMALAAA